MDVYTVTYLDKKVNVNGTIYFNGRPVQIKRYDAILWLTDDEKPYPPVCHQVDNLRLLVIYLKDVYRAITLKELGYG